MPQDNRVFSALKFKSFSGRSKTFFEKYHACLPKSQPHHTQRIRYGLFDGVCSLLHYWRYLICEDRLYELYHYLNHTLLFGVSYVFQSQKPWVRSKLEDISLIHIHSTRENSEWIPSRNHIDYEGIDSLCRETLTIWLTWGMVKALKMPPIDECSRMSPSPFCWSSKL